MNKKKIITIVIAAILAIGGVIGTVLGVQAHQTNKEYEQLAENVAECKRMVNNMNYVYFPEDDTAKAARQHDLDSIAKFEEQIASKDMTTEEKSAFAVFCKSIKENFEKCKNDTKTQFDAVQTQKDGRTDEGYYSDEFNNEWNGYVNQFNDFYGKEQYFDAFKVVLTMQNKLNEYVAMKDQEAADKAEAERQAAEAEASAAKTIKNSSGSSKSSSSKSSSGSSSKSSNSNSYSNEGDGSDDSGNSGSSGQRYKDGDMRNNPKTNSVENVYNQFKQWEAEGRTMIIKDDSYH